MTLLLLLCAAFVAGPAAAEPFADGVVAYTIGTGGGAREAELPGVVLGPPRGGGPFQGTFDTFSLGLGGSIVLEFTDNVIVDGKHRAALVASLGRPEALRLRLVSRRILKEVFFERIYSFALRLRRDYSVNHMLIKALIDEPRA